MHHFNLLDAAPVTIRPPWAHAASKRIPMLTLTPFHITRRPRNATVLRSFPTITDEELDRLTGD